MRRGRADTSAYSLTSFGGKHLCPECLEIAKVHAAHAVAASSAEAPPQHGGWLKSFVASLVRRSRRS